MRLYFTAKLLNRYTTLIMCYPKKRVGKDNIGPREKSPNE